MASSGGAALARFAAALRFQDLPSEVVSATKVYLLDNLAAGFAGCATPWAEMAWGLAQENGAAGPCSVFGKRERLAPSYAALVNGVIVGGFECDHAFVQGSAHPGAAVFPAVLAVAQRDRATGKALLLSMALGYEALCRIGLAATRAVEDVRGFHGPGTNAAFGAAVGAAKALGLNARGLLNAIGIAGSHGGGLLEFVREGAMTKRLHVGRGAQMGLESALLAAQGFTGPTAALEGPRGFLQAYSPAPRPDALTDGLGQRWAMLDITLKAFPCHASFHAVIEAACRLRAKARTGHSTTTSAIERVQVTAGGWMMEPRFHQREPPTLLGAQYSLPFSLALALLHGMESPSVFNERALRDRQVLALARRIKLVKGKPGASSAPPGKLSVTFDGHTHSMPIKDWKGAPSNPYTYDEMAQKFQRYAAAMLPEARIAEIVERVAALERQRDVSVLAHLIEAV